MQESVFVIYIYVCVCVCAREYMLYMCVCVCVFPFVAIVLTCVVTKYTSLYLVHLFMLINFYSIRACPVEFMLR